MHSVTAVRKGGMLRHRMPALRERGKNALLFLFVISMLVPLIGGMGDLSVSAAPAGEKSVVTLYAHPNATATSMSFLGLHAMNTTVLDDQSTLIVAGAEALVPTTLATFALDSAVTRTVTVSGSLEGTFYIKSSVSGAWAQVSMNLIDEAGTTLATGSTTEFFSFSDHYTAVEIKTNSVVTEIAAGSAFAVQLVMTPQITSDITLAGDSIETPSRVEIPLTGHLAVIGLDFYDVLGNERSEFSTTWAGFSARVNIGATVQNAFGTGAIADTSVTIRPASGSPDETYTSSGVSEPGQINQAAGSIAYFWSWGYSANATLGGYLVDIDVVDTSGNIVVHSVENGYRLTSAAIPLNPDENGNDVPIAWDVDKLTADYGASDIIMIGAPVALFFAAFTLGAKYVTPDNVLKNPMRATIFEYIKNNPGVHLRELKNNLNIALSSLSWHLTKLEEAELVKSKKFGGFKLYYPVEGGIETMKISLARNILKNKNARDIFAYLAVHPGTNSSRIAASLNISRITVKWHIDRAEMAGLVEISRTGSREQYFITEFAVGVVKEVDKVVASVASS